MRIEKTQKSTRNERWMVENRMIMFNMGRGRRIDDRAKKGRSEYKERGMRIVKVYMEGEGGRQNEGIKFLTLSY